MPSIAQAEKGLQKQINLSKMQARAGLIEHKKKFFCLALPAFGRSLGQISSYAYDKVVTARSKGK